MIDPLTDEEVLTLRRILSNRRWVIRGIWTAIGTGIGGGILALIFDL